ncbi:MAG TPA: FAD-dependent oxidoreductase, partial [Polyangiaceae bacterium]|nr:FAD-dependent oxidoreductase [Polyangiaceae bacterium]
VLFYLDQDIELSHGHAIYADSPWALTGISQQRFWTGLSLADYGQGNVQGILSTVISDWDTAGTAVVNKAARFCTAQEIKDEVWAQLVLHHANADPSAQLGGVTVHDWFLDPAITPSAAGATNDEPLLINNVDSWKDRPEATTLVPNLFLASDYVRTNSDLACMEGANEAARRAVNGILAASGSAAPICPIYELREPAFFEAAQAADDVLFAINPRSAPPLCEFSTRLEPTGVPTVPTVPTVPPVSTSTGCSPWIIVLLVLVAALFLFVLLSNA